MSEREKTSEQIEDYLEGDSYFNAPYGILPGIEPLGRGKIRTIAFGVNRYLDATIRIYTPKKIVVRGQGGLAYKFDGTYYSAEELISHFKKETKYSD